MPQLVLDPRQAQSNGTTWRPTGPLPAKVRAFALFPNIDDWLPGDLVLVSPVFPDWIERQIVDAQTRCGYSPEDARWHHAAVYMGDGYVCEAGTSGVRYAAIFNYVGDHLIRLRRDFDLTSDQRWRLAIQAVVRLGEPYGFRDILSIYKTSFSMSWTSAVRAQFDARKRSVICSQLFANAYSVVTSKLVSTTASNAIIPATLSFSRTLSDVPLHWKGIL
jgi:hypothetical protein